jgi:hypothetical protein
MGAVISGFMQILKVYFLAFHGVLMNSNDKVRYGMMALTGSSVVLAAFGLHINPLAAIGGIGAGGVPIF